MAASVNGSSYAGSVASSRSSASIRARAEREQQEGQGEDLLDRRSPLENGIFGVLFTLSKENSETRIRIRWVLLKILLDAWQLFTTVINPAKQGWDIDSNRIAWKIVSVLNFTWLGDLGYGAYLAVLYSMVALLAFNVGLCVWVAWCFKEHKFPVVWPIKVLQVFSSVFFQAFDVTSLNLLQLGISCRYTGYEDDRLHFNLFPKYSCTEPPHIMHAVVSALSLILFVVIALLLNMAEVEVNPLSRRPMALGHSGAEVMAFAIKVLLTMVDVFIGWQKVAACIYLALAIALAYQYLRWSPHLVPWVNYLKSGVSASILWSCAVLTVLIFLRPDTKKDLAETLTIILLAGLGPAFCAGAALSWAAIRRMTAVALKSLADAKPDVKLEDICDNLDDPRDVEIVARCCRVWKDRYTLDSDALNRAHQVIKAGLAMFPNSAYMVLLHGNFMIDVLGVSQSGSSRIEDARKLNPALMCRFIMFVRQQQATQKAAGSANEGTSMDLLGYVEYQRKQRMVVRLHREALQAMCNFWKALDASRVSFMHLSKALSKIESSVSQAQTAYRVVLESYGTNPKLVRLYGKFLQTIKNDPWRASEYFAEADRLEELKNGDARGPLLPDGTPLGRMDEMSTAVLVISATGEVQMANKHTHLLFGYKRGTLEGKPLSILLAPHVGRRITERVTQLVSSSGLAAATGIDNPKISHDEAVVGMHYDRLAFPVKLSLRKVSGVGEDSTFVAMIEPLPSTPGVSSLWVAPNGTVAACDPQFVGSFGWKATEVNGANIMAFLAVRGPPVVGPGDEELGAPKILYDESPSDMISRLLAEAKISTDNDVIQPVGLGLKCAVLHKYDSTPQPCTVMVVDNGGGEAPVFELRIKLESEPLQLLVANRKGTILHISPELVSTLRDVARNGHAGPKLNRLSSLNGAPNFRAGGGGSAAQVGPSGLGSAGADDLAGYSLSDFLPSPWKDMHTKFLKETTALTPPGRSHWTCRRSAAPGPTLELRTATGKSVFMQVAVTTLDISGELNHVVWMSRSSLETALSERRLRLSVNADGLVTGLSDGLPRQLFGLEPSQIVGRGLWEIVEELTQMEGERLATPGPKMLNALVSRAVSSPGQSWRVQVAPPQKARQQGGILDIAAAARASMSKQAVMQVFVEFASDGPSREAEPEIFVDLWPLASVTAVLELDATGRVRSVLEERLRPAGLLFGLSTQALVGSSLTSLVTLPPGRTRVGDLLSLHGAKKSSLKSTKKETSIKAGPIHVLCGLHTDGRAAQLDVQVVGKPGPGQAMHAIMRFHVAPMVPSGAVGMGPSGGLGGTRTSVYTVVPPAAPPTAPLVKAVTSVGETGALTGGTTGLSKLRLGSAEMTAGGAGSKRWGLSALVTGDEAMMRRSISMDPAEATPSAAARTRTGSPRPTGYSSNLEVGGVGIVSPVPSPPDGLASGMADGLPVPGVTSGKAAALLGRSKLAVLVKSAGGGAGVGDGGDSDGEGKAAGGPPPLGSARMISRKERKARPVGSGAARSERPLPGTPTRTAACANLDSPLDGGIEAILAAAKKGAPAIDVQSVEYSDDNASDPGTTRVLGNGRISTWVASKGAYYQNSIGANVQSDDEKSRRSGDFSDGGGGADVIARVDALASPARTDLDRKNSFSPGPRSEFGPYPEEDAASEGGQSAMSAQSGTGGAEYKRGKRFRKLIKLMDSSQAQQVQERFRTHALATVAFLAIVHVVCFAFIVTAIQSQRNSMLTLGHNGEAQRFMQQILIDVRSLDVISRGKTVSWIYNDTQASTFVDRISKNAEIVKERLNGMLGGHHEASSPVLKLFFYTTRAVWNGRYPNGTDIYTNLTIWDFSTRFYTMSTNIVQHYHDWVTEGRYVSDTDAGQFLLKSGPDLFSDSRKILDALLYEAADNVHWVDTLQLIFLAVEGTAISFVAACYLAYLLRAVAAQRHKLYATFLVIPLGLTRALASQNTALLVDEDDDDELDDEDERPAQVPGEDEAEENDGGSKTVKRRATLNIAADAGSVASGIGGDGGASDRVGPAAMSRSRSLPRSLSAAGDKRGLEGIGSQDPKPRQRMAASGTLDVAADRPGRCWPLRHLWRFITRADRRVSPLQQQSLNVAVSRRKLKDDSHETVVMMVPFVFWSAVVVTIYSIAVIHMKGVVEVVAIHSVSNFMAARTYRTIFFCQELAVVEDPAELMPRREALFVVMKLVRDAWYTLQLGKNAYLAAGPTTERFPLVKDGLAYASPEISTRFYGTGLCHRQEEHLPCVGSNNRFYQVTRTGLDSMMQQFMMSISAMATNTSMVPEGLQDEHFDYVYNVGRVDLADGTVNVEIAHYDTIIELFHSILVLHVILFLVLWVVFAGFLIMLLNPLLKRISKERRRIAELMSQLPLELDVERLVARALGTVPNTAAGSPQAAGAAGKSGLSDACVDCGDDMKGAETTSKWRAIIRSASATAQKSNTAQRQNSSGLSPAAKKV